MPTSPIADIYSKAAQTANYLNQMQEQQRQRDIEKQLGGIMSSAPSYREGVQGILKSGLLSPNQSIQMMQELDRLEKAEVEKAKAQRFQDLAMQAAGPAPTLEGQAGSITETPSINAVPAGDLSVAVPQVGFEKQTTLTQPTLGPTVQHGQEMDKWGRERAFAELYPKEYIENKMAVEKGRAGVSDAEVGKAGVGINPSTGKLETYYLNRKTGAVVWTGVEVPPGGKAGETLAEYNRLVSKELAGEKLTSAEEQTKYQFQGTLAKTRAREHEATYVDKTGKKWKVILDTAPDGSAPIIAGVEEVPSVRSGAAEIASKDVVSWNTKERPILEDVAVGLKPQLFTYEARLRTFMQTPIGQIDPAYKDQMAIERKQVVQMIDTAFNAYRNRITGAAAAVQELEQLKSAYLDGTASASDLMAGLDNLLRIGDRQSELSYLYSQGQIPQSDYDRMTKQTVSEGRARIQSLLGKKTPSKSPALQDLLK